MAEPIIPSGRDYDAGLVPGDRKGVRRGLLGRIASKVRRGRGSKVHEFELRLDPRIAAHQAPPARRLPSPPPEDPTTSREPIRAEADQPIQRAQPTPARRISSPRPKPRGTPQAKQPIAPSLENLLEAQIRGGSLGLSTWLLIANPDDCGALAIEYLDKLVTHSEDAMLASVVQWRLSAAAVGEAASRTLARDVASAPGLPADIAEVLRFLDTNPMSLAAYRRGVELSAVKAAALARLRQFCRNYPSAEVVLQALEAGDVSTASRALKFDSAAWIQGMSIIRAAMAAVEGATLAVDIPECRIPRTWLEGSDAQRCMAAALSSIVPDDERSRLRRRFEPEFTAAIASMSDEHRAQAAVWLSARGVSLIAPTPAPIRRQLRLPGQSSVPRAR
jgi:hypothetical protein